MTDRTEFHRIWAERRNWPRGSADWEYLTRALRKLAWIIKGKPVGEWK